jgi:hypothetical protein
MANNLTHICLHGAGSAPNTTLKQSFNETSRSLMPGFIIKADEMGTTITGIFF